MSKKNRSKIGCIAIFAILICATALIAAYSAFYGNALKERVLVKVYSNTTYNDLRNEITPHLRTTLHQLAFDLYASRLNLENRIHSGYYIFEDGTDVIRLVRRLVLGEQTPVQLVIGGARTLPELAGKISAQIETDSISLLQTMRDKQLRKELGMVKDSTIALFIPNTYEVWWSTSPKELMQRINRENSRFWSAERTAKLKRCGLSKYEVMTLASIVYEEVKIPSEMNIIAGVYINRLRRGMPLQADPTIKYAMGDFGLKRILYKHLKYRSPFNTYINRGLPPAPICVPSIDAIDAVLNYTEHDYLYFCARPELDGRHNFARSYKEHTVNARNYSEALNRRKIK